VAVALLLGCMACAGAQLHLRTKLLYRFTDGENGNQPLGECALRWSAAAQRADGEAR